MQIYEREILKVWHHPDKSCIHKPCDSEDMFLICYVSSREQMFKGLVNLCVKALHNESPHFYVWWPLV